MPEESPGPRTEGILSVEGKISIAVSAMARDLGNGMSVGQALAHGHQIVSSYGVSTAFKNELARHQTELLVGHILMRYRYPEYE